MFVILRIPSILFKYLGLLNDTHPTPCYSLGIREGDHGRRVSAEARSDSSTPEIATSPSFHVPGKGLADRNQPGGFRFYLDNQVLRLEIVRHSDVTLEVLEMLELHFVTRRR